MAPMAPKLIASSRRLSKERRLQYAGGEIDVVHLRVVIGIDRRRRHVPFLAVHRFADFSQLAVEFEAGGTEGIAQRVATRDLQFGIVTPLVRVPILLADMDPV